MPLEHGSSREAFSHNVSELMKAGHSQSQSLAIAYKEKEGHDAANGTVKCAGILYIEDNNYLLLKRPDGAWDLPGGHLEDGESFMDGARRESAEEVGYKPDPDQLFQVAYTNNGRVQYTTYSCRTGFEVILNLEEHSEYRWFPFGECPDVMHPNLRDVVMAYTRTYGMDRKEMDVNGWPEFKDNPISKAGVFEYYGRSIDASLIPDQKYRVLRSPEELSRPETIESFKLVPWIDEHVMLGPDGSGMVAPEYKGIEGVIGENVYYDAATGYLRANIKVFSNNMQELQQAGKRELSAGYRCKYKISAGVWNGQQYDVIQYNIRGNHLALVNEGRMGPDVAVLDHRLNFTFDAREVPMAMDPELKKEMDALTKMVADSMKAMDAKLDDGIKAMDKRAKDAEEKYKEGDTELSAADKAAKDAEEKKADEAKKAEDRKAMDASIKAAMDAALSPLQATLSQLQGVATAQTAAQDAAAKTKLLGKLAEFGYAVDGALELPALRKAAVAKIGVPCIDGQEAVALDGFFHGREAPSDEVGFTFDSANSSDEALDKFLKSH